MSSLILRFMLDSWGGIESPVNRCGPFQASAAKLLRMRSALTIARRFGFGSLAVFSREYTRAYGANPSIVLRQARQIF